MRECVRAACGKWARWCDAGGKRRTGCSQRLVGDEAGEATGEATQTDGRSTVRGGGKNSTASSPGPPSDHVVFSKDEEGSVVFPFSQRTGPDDDHRGGAAASKFRSRSASGNSEKIQKVGGDLRGEERRAAAAGRRRKEGLGFGLASGVDKRGGRGAGRRGRGRF